jgi:CheY-like chemotaxis protein
MPKILVVEDSPTQAIRISYLLEDAGFETEIVSDGEKALEFLKQAEPAVIVTDLWMPKLNGLELAKAVRQDHPGVPVVLITAHGSEDVAADALRAGATSYLMKSHLTRDLVPIVSGIVALAPPERDENLLLNHLDEVHYRFTLGNDVSAIAPLVARFEETITHLGLCDRSGMIRVAVAVREALVNAIEHGNLELDSDLRQHDETIYNRLGDDRRTAQPYVDRRVNFDVSLTRSEARFVIQDQGPGFDPTRAPTAEDSANNDSCNGRGLVLIRSIMDGVRHNRLGNQITMIKYADSDPRAKKNTPNESASAVA